MNCKRILLVFLILSQTLFLFSQKNYNFTYDANGNRLTRSLRVNQLKSATIKFPVTDPSNLKLADDKKNLENETRELKTTVYPNPNKGIIKISVSNMPENHVTELRLFNLSGSELMVKRDFESYSETDISQYKDGIYILRIKINDKVFDWKIVKSNY